MTDDLVWLPGAAGCRARTEPIAGVVWHHTGGEGDPDAVVRVLKQRGLSVHFVIGYDGTIKRCADPATTVCFHAGSKANGRFIGVEVSNKALGPATAKHPRQTVTASAHGRRFQMLDFSERQYASITSLADELSARFNIPRVTSHTDTIVDIAKFLGHVEHVGISRKKIDAGNLVMQRLRAHGYA